MSAGQLYTSRQWPPASRQETQLQPSTAKAGQHVAVDGRGRAAHWQVHIACCLSGQPPIKVLVAQHYSEWLVPAVDGDGLCRDVVGHGAHQ